MSAFPYLPVMPDGHCELCGRAGALVEITVAPAEQVVVKTPDGPRSRWRTRRTALACPRHAGANGGPVITPHKTMAPGTSQLRPQQLRLFDHIPYRLAGEAMRRVS